VSVLNSWDREGPCENITTQKTEEQQKKLKELIDRRENKMNQRIFWRKNRTVVTVAAIAVLSLAAFISAPIKKALEPPLTMGMNPIEVVDAYYSCFESMDQELMSDCIDEDAGKPDLNEVMNFFVTSRVRQGYEGKTGLLPAAEWVANGRPMPEAGMTVYGLSDIMITPMESNRFLVIYEKWVPGNPPDNADLNSIEPVYPQGYKIQDTLLLEQMKKGNWKITDLKRTAKEL
jgi:hypothetical protein